MPALCKSRWVRSGPLGPEFCTVGPTHFYLSARAGVDFRSLFSGYYCYPEGDLLKRFFVCFYHVCEMFGEFLRKVSSEQVYDTNIVLLMSRRGRCATRGLGVRHSHGWFYAHLREESQARAGLPSGGAQRSCPGCRGGETPGTGEVLGFRSGPSALGFSSRWPPQELACRPGPTLRAALTGCPVPGRAGAVLPGTGCCLLVLT